MARADKIIVGAIEAQLATSTVVTTAVVDWNGVSHAHSFQAHHVGHLVRNGLPAAGALPVEAVHTVNAPALPVCPVEVGAQQAEAKCMGQFVADHFRSVATIKVNHLQKSLS